MPTEPARPHALRSGAFRFAVTLALVFAAGSALLLWAVERQVSGFAVAATRSMLQSESVILTGEYDQLGRAGLIDALRRHSKVTGEAPFRYLLIDSGGHRLFGNLPAAWAAPGWSSIANGEVEEDGSTTPLRLYGTRLNGGLTLVVGTDAFDVDALRARLVAFTLWSGIAIALLALVGGYFAGRLFLGRLNRINRAVARIMDGHRESLPEIGVAPEFAQLVGNLNRMLERQADAMDALRQVSTAIAHDLRTPLTRLQQRLDALRTATVVDRGGIEDAVAQVDGILGIFQALLRIGMLEGGAGRQRFTRVALGDVVDRLCQTYEPVAEDAGKILSWRASSGLFVAGDEALLSQLLVNLIENAIVHTPVGTQIAVALDRIGANAVLRVADDGPGVSPDERDRIFRRFYRADRSRGSPGAGLGLSLVAAIADLHGGQHRVLPEPTGLAIEIALPAID